jgi:hypothetical protein
MNKKIFFGLITLAALFSCGKETIELDSKSSSIVGKWENQTYSNDTITFTKAPEKKEYEYLLEFKSDGSLLERKNAGWCGTPPIAYADYDGSWEMKDSIIRVSVGYWGGQAKYEWKLISVSQNQLKMAIIKTEFNEK